LDLTGSVFSNKRFTRRDILDFFQDLLLENPHTISVVFIKRGAYAVGLQTFESGRTKSFTFHLDPHGGTFGSHLAQLLRQRSWVSNDVSHKSGDVFPISF
jgi:hypothetical protein